MLKKLSRYLLFPSAYFLLLAGAFAVEPTYDEAKAQIVELVKKFESGKSFYTSSDFLEKDTRKEFIDPFFEALGWDVSNDEHHSLLLQDTVPETRLPIEGSLKFADYGMRLDARAVFYVEAKAASKDIDKAEYTYQAKRYAWSSMRANLVVLTDFETFRVFDARIQPSFDAMAEGMIAEFRMSYKDYAEKFPLIWATFSKEAVRKGSLVKLLEKTDKKLERIPADQHFISDFDAKRLALGQVLLENNPKLSDAELNAATLHILNRIVFTRILEDRDIEPIGRLRDCMLQSKEGKGSLSELLKKEFARLHKRYNNVLFAENPAIDSLHIPEGVLQNLIMSYYPPNSPYDFSAMPVSVLGKTYENCLGKLLVRHDGKLQLELKPEIREAGGIFYTPEWAANEITRRVLEPQLKGLSPDKMVSKSRIIDPACGCGAFILSAAKYLFDAALEYYKTHPELIGKPDEWPDAYINDYGKLRLSVRLKAKLIENSIHGVDVDAQAVEVTRLWLYILMLEEEGSPVLEEERHYKIPNKTQKQPQFTLPDLKKNIICADTLAENSPLKNNSYSAVIGNPPYLRLSAMNRYIPEQYKYLREHYTFLSEGQPDLYCAFVEKGISLMADKGRLGFLLSNKILTVDYAKPMRQAITSQNLLDELINFGPAELFQDAKVNTAALILEKSPKVSFKYSRLTQRDALRTFLEKYACAEYEDETMFIRTLPPMPCSSEKWAIPSKTKAASLQCMDTCKLKLQEICIVFSGAMTGNDTVLVVTPEKEETGKTLVTSKAEKDALWLESKLLKPFVFGSGSIQRYHPVTTKKQIIWPYSDDNLAISEGTFQKDFPLTWNYLTKHKEELHSDLKPWYGLYRHPTPMFSPKLITTASVRGKAKVAIDLTGECVVKGNGICCGVISQNKLYSLEVLLGILNSSLVYDYVSLRTSDLGENYAYPTKILENLPIPENNEKTAQIYQALHEKVKEILSTEDEKKRQELEDAIDALVLKLYQAAAGVQKDSTKLYRRIPAANVSGIRQSA